MTKREVYLEGGAPWGFRMNGGADSGHPLRISRVNPGSKAAQQGVREGDVISAINGAPTRLLSNGESHALLRSAGPTLTLGLNQDCTGSPKRRSRESNRRGEAGTGTQETKSPSDSVTNAQVKTVVETACTSSSQPNKQGKKTKQRRQENKEDEQIKSKESISACKDNPILEKDENAQTTESQTSQKMSSSKARRLRKARLKIKIKENSGNDSFNEKNVIKDVSPYSVVSTTTNEDNSLISISNADEIEYIPSSSNITTSQQNNIATNEIDLQCDEKSCDKKIKEEKRKDKSEDKSFNVQTSCGKLFNTLNNNKSWHKNYKNSNSVVDITAQSSLSSEKSDNTVEVKTNEKITSETETNLSREVQSETISIKKVTNNLSKTVTQLKNVSSKTKEDIPPCIKETVKILDSSLINNKSNVNDASKKSETKSTSKCSTNTKICYKSENSHKKNGSSDTSSIDISSPCKKEIVKIVDCTKLNNKISTEKSDKAESQNSFQKEIVRIMDTRIERNILSTESEVKCRENKALIPCEKEAEDIIDNMSVNTNYSEMTMVEGMKEICDSDSEYRSVLALRPDDHSEEICECDSNNVHLNRTITESSHIEVVVNPPTPTMGVENTFFGPNWESIEELETSSGPVSSDEDVHQEYFVHFPPNDLRVQVSSPLLVEDGKDDYGLTVQDIRNPIIPPEEEAKLRSFLETLDLTKPEEYDDSSSNKSSEEALVSSEPECYATKQEVVVYKNCKRRSVAEPCYIPSPHRQYLDVITEENSDLSDCDRKSEERPWENSDIIRKNNEFDSIPDDWMDSDNEIEYGYDDDGGIKSWSEGTTLDEAEGVEIIYLDSDNSDDVVVKEQELNEKPQLVVVKTKEINKVLLLDAGEKNLHSSFELENLQSETSYNGINTTEDTNVRSKDNAAIKVQTENSQFQLGNHYINVADDSQKQVIQSQLENLDSCTINKLPGSIVRSAVNIDKAVNYENHQECCEKTLVDVKLTENNCNENKYVNATQINNDGIEAENYCINENDLGHKVNNSLQSLDLIKNDTKCYFNFDDEIKEVSEFESLFKSLTSKSEKAATNLSQENLADHENRDALHKVIEQKCPLPEEKLDVSVTPALSRQNSSGSGTPTTQSTTRCTTSQSPTFNEKEDKTDNNELMSNFCLELELKAPESLKELSAKKVISLPNGVRLLEEVGIIRFSSESLVYDRNYNCYKDKSASPRNISRRSSTLPESPAETHPTSRPLSLGSSSLPNDVFSPRSGSVLMFTPPYSPPYSVTFCNEEPWVSLQTSEENLRVCLSPSQCKSRTLPASPKEAAGLLDLHKKFIQRRGYYEDKRRYSNDNLPSPDLIQLEHCNEMRKPLDYTPELLTEAANLLALKEYRRSRFAENSNQENFDKGCHSLNETIDELSAINSAEIKEPSHNEEECEIKKNKLRKCFDCSAQKEKESKRKGKVFDSDFTCEIPASYEIFSDTKGGELEVEESSKREEHGRVLEPSDGSRLLALIQSQIYPAAKAHCPIATTALCNPLFDRTGEEIGTKFTGSGDFVSGWLTMSRNVTQSEGKRVFDAEQYRISKQGDIAVMLSPDSKRPDRPKSLPPVGSGGEIFRKKMYDEYMDKVAERYERRQQKVIKISDRPSSMFVSREELKDVTLPFDVPKLEDEFMYKVKERMNKLGISLEDDDTDNTDKEELQLPKHLQEFVQLTSESPKNGVWSPVQTPEAQRKTFDFASAQKEREKEKEEEEKKKGEDDQTSVVWTPRTVPSPPVEKKSFRPINFESPPPVRKSYQPVNEEILKPPTSLPITPSDWTHKDKSEKTIISESIDTHRRLTSSQSAESSLAASTETTLPRAPNPTITLLQKAREGQLPRGAHYLEEETERSNIEKREERRLVEPNEIIYTVRREYNSESEDKKPKKFVDLGPRKFEGIGPTTKEGIPIVLRSEVKDANQQKWYKRMYDSLHRAEKDRELVTVRYKPNRRGYPYSLGGGYLSEPDRLGTDYDSDAVSSKYATLDRRRIRNKENDFTTSTMPRSKYASGSVKHAVDVYKNQPGRIEDYEPGRSSISEKEAKQWWDEVLDIFDEQFEQSQKASKPPPTTPNTRKPFMTYALKESGYESDSQLVFKRRDENLQNQMAMSPSEQKMAYKVIQKGGEVPLHGLRKPAPERPKEPISGGAIPVPERDFHSKQQRPESPHRYVESEVTIHYRSPVRSEAKEAWSEEELARRQAEAMRRIYQEERRRKYLQELQDMYSRRHTDNFIPSQKSPIPLNRYDDFLDDVSPTKPRDHTPEPKLVARALYNFVGQSSRELTFRRGDVIFVRRQIDKNWYEGEHNAMIGLFPINYVEIIPYDGIRTTPKRPSEGQARAKFNFQAQTHLELSLVKGELIVLTRRVDDNWFEGRIGSRKGIFPVSYVEVLVEPGDRNVSPVRPTTPASNKPVASPAAHSLMLNGSKNSLSHHHYTPPPPVSYTSLSRSSKTIKSDLAPVNQALHIDTQSEPVPYRALYNYKPQNDDELELNEGDTVYVMEKCDDGWYVGSSQRTGCFGTFPGNYVQRLSRGH